MNSALLNELKAIGCPVDNTLENTFMGNEAFFEKMLKKFGTNHALETLEAGIVSGSVSNCFDAAHELKGMYGNLGLGPLFTLCSDIVETTRRGSLDGVAARFEELKKEHLRVLDVIARY